MQTLGLGFARGPFVEACRRRHGDVVTFRTLFDSGFVMILDPAADPRTFRPERFLRADPPATVAWIPFGGGTRRCLGASFAQFEMKVVIGRVLERAELRLVGRRREPVVRRAVSPPTPSAIGRSLRPGGRWSRSAGCVSC